MKTLVLALLLITPQLFAAQSHFLKNIVIAEDEVVEGDLSIYKGDLLLKGEVNGNVAVIFGDCTLEEGARVGGDLVVMQGELVLHHPNQVSGRISHKEVKAAAGEGDSGPFAFSEDAELEEDSKGSSRKHDDSDVDVLLSFNRVAGFKLGLSFASDKEAMRDRLFDLTGNAAWAFGQKRPEWNLKLRKSLWEKPGIYVGLGMHRQTDSQDRWMLDSGENSVAGWLLKQDFFDWYDSRGGMVELGAFLLENKLHISAGWFRESYGPLEKTTEWNWSPIDRPYRVNHFSDLLGFSEGSNEGLRYALDYKLGTPGARRSLAMGLQLEENFATDDEPWDYRRWLGRIELNLPIGSRDFEEVGLRLLAGDVDGSAPEPWRFRLGGPGTLPGYRPKAIDGMNDGDIADRISSSLVDDQGEVLGGDRMVLAQLKNRISAKALHFWPLDDLDLLLMANAGTVFNHDWSDLETGDLQADVGLGVGDSDRDWEFGLFRRTDSGKADWRMQFRLDLDF
jgi:hypothetical protein